MSHHSEKKARALGINHVVLKAGDLDAARPRLRNRPLPLANTINLSMSC